MKENQLTIVYPSDTRASLFDSKNYLGKQVSRCTAGGLDDVVTPPPGLFVWGLRVVVPVAVCGV